MFWQTSAPSELQAGKLCREDQFGLLRSIQQDVTRERETLLGQRCPHADA